MGLSYHFKLTAPATASATELERFLLGVERTAKQLGFDPTTVLNVAFDTPERHAFARRLTTGLYVRSDSLRAIDLPSSLVWSHNREEGTCRLIPTQSVVLVVTNERKEEAVFGFFKYPQDLIDRLGQSVVALSNGGEWFFRDSLKTSDERYRTLIGCFAKAGFVAESKDEFSELSLPARTNKTT